MTRHRLTDYNLPQSTDTACLQQKGRSLMQRQPSPSLRKRTKNVSMSNNQHIGTLRIRISLGLVQCWSMEPFPNLLDETVTALIDIRGTPAEKKEQDSMLISHQFAKITKQYAKISGQEIANGALHSLSSRTPIPPNIPVGIEALFFPLLPDLGAGNAFIVTVIPLADVLGNFNLCVAWNWLGLALAVTLPWQRTLETEV